MGFTKPSTLFTILVTSAAALDPSRLSALFPTAEPTVTDDWECAISTYSPYFSPPKPTGALYSALLSYGSKLQEPCTELCPYPDATRWCGFTTAAPNAVLPIYTSYASSASVWWAEHSSAAVDLAQNCPQYWYDATRETPAGPGWLNGTIINAECFAGMHADASPSNTDGASVTSLALASATASQGAASTRPSAAISAPSSVVTSSSATKMAFDGGKELLLPAFVNVVGLALLL